MSLLSALTVTFALCLSNALARYVLQDDYFEVDEHGAFFDKFRFWEDEDPTKGFVLYKNYGDCLEAGLISNTTVNVIMRADSHNIAPFGRSSVRIESKKTYDHGLLVIDLDHMPGSICGVWPAFWSYGPSWPNDGEIDIIEGINQFRANRMSLHTGPGCYLKNRTTHFHAYSGEVLYTHCTPSNTSNTGCSIGSFDLTTYGDGFNAIGRGIYATEWTSKHISIWFFPRHSIRKDVNGPLGRTPDPGTWGLPLSRFDLTCDIGMNFKNHSIVFDITFCGGWAGGKQWNTSIPVNSTWPPTHNQRNTSCAAKTGCTCEDWVRDHPEAFEEAYWSVNALRVYQDVKDEW
ncbi:Endo-1,3(4)-beta-glucanase [Pseudocercospora fuligena]|uniref:Endo-1,3(4)-beta-glucanase n=1 Tax=Pseudocercospora fuligena TaxID=685502 RepID=A0A8H6VL19_9PEZI|nr:Endo-1,3(4)-beta-glucanase [Pseudocercospora fuligena]